MNKEELIIKKNYIGDQLKKRLGKHKFNDLIARFKDEQELSKLVPSITCTICKCYYFDKLIKQSNGYLFCENCEIKQKEFIEHKNECEKCNEDYKYDIYYINISKSYPFKQSCEYK